MKTIIDAETGELVEVETPNELAVRKLTELGVIKQGTLDMLSNYVYYKEQFDLFKHELEKAMTENGIKKWDNDYFVASATEETTQVRLDTDRLKEDGVYDRYLKVVPVKASVRVRFKKGFE